MAQRSAIVSWLDYLVHPYSESSVVDVDTDIHEIEYIAQVNPFSIMSGL